MTTTKTRHPLLEHFTIPDDGETKHVLVPPNGIAFVSVHHEEGMPSPLEDCDGMGMIRSFSRRHSSSIRSEEEFHALVAEHPDFVYLSYFEHGQCMWGVRGSMGGMPDFRWDGTDVAGIWYPDATLVDAAKDLKGKKRKAKFEEWAAQACETYTKWCNGEVYYYTVDAYRMRGQFDRREDYRFDNPVFEDSCGGIYDDDDNYLRETVFEALTSAVEELEALEA